LRAEFGHPDVTVILTCLSYYNHGLTNGHLDTCFELLYKLDNPVLEYEQWVRQNKDIPPQLHQLSGVNLKDRRQFIQALVPAFSRNSAVVNFFLSSIVFPKEAKVFPYKLSTSGWDLADDVKFHVTTGFSGTKDNQYLLPTSITQADPVKQSSTNALVLTYLLQPENNYYLCTRGANGETCSAKEFLELVVKQEPEIRVLLDVGAQMLELQNEDLVRYWLKLRPDIDAAVYFNDKDEPMILSQSGISAAFFSSPFAQQLDKCVVYLDDGHTRGTDLKIPRGTRAAVTLGPKVTKDRLLQSTSYCRYNNIETTLTHNPGCMRMRKLGHGHSVMFFAPVEIDTQIREARGDRQNLDESAIPESSDKREDYDNSGRPGLLSDVAALDVIRWAMLETCKDLDHHISHWAFQGLEHSRRSKAYQTYASTNQLEVLKCGWKVPESRSLIRMYGASSATTTASSTFTGRAFQIPSLEKRLNDLGIKKLEDPSMEEEQERELSHEIEQQHQMERPPKSQPVIHTLHQDVRFFVQSGFIPRNSRGITSLFHHLDSSGSHSPAVWSPKLRATIDFCTTSATSDIATLNPYMRPLNWILSAPDGTLVAISPYEANELLPHIQKSSSVRLHVFAPRVTRSMFSFSGLRFYSVPSPSTSHPTRLIQLQINLFAGQLYLDDYDDYRSMCAFLGIYLDGDDFNDKIRVQSDGFVLTQDRRRLGYRRPEYLACGFSSSPVTMLKDLIGYRRKGMEYLRTHVGQILHARRMSPSDF
jgi:hypothetical protein